jgi:Abnormal spindle-like microcephaly-assoc'd, ASPM-SPD-2-Hydin
MKSLRPTSVTLMAVFCLLALQVQLKAQEWQKHSFAELINDSDEIVGFSETSTPNPLVATTVKLSPTHLSFGFARINTNSSPQTVALTNVGTSSLSIYGIAITGIDPRDFSQTHTCSRLARGASCNIKVTFRPTTAGTRTAALSIRDNGGGSPQMVPLSGTGYIVCPGCIALCLIGSGNKLTGECLEGARGGICHVGGASSTQCPAGAKAERPVSRQCGDFGNFLVDASRPCQ